MPVWHEATREWVQAGRLAVLGITQEQHLDRCRLFAQWKQLDYPILSDPINVFQSAAVPIFVTIDEHGIVRHVRPRLATIWHDFLDVKFENSCPDKPSAIVEKGDLMTRQLKAQTEDTTDAWRTNGDALVLWGGLPRVHDAIEAYQKAVRKSPEDANSLFRLGVCYRMRHESPNRRKNDFQMAVDSWGKALALKPNQYIWRRRIQQFGPRLDKPYPFYDWVDEAVSDIRNRNENPVELSVRPQGAEIARPSRRFEVESNEQLPPDPRGEITRDQGLIHTEVTVVPATDAAKRDFRVHITFIPNAKRTAHWNNDVAPLCLWVDVPEGWELSQQLHVAAQGKKSVTNEVRQVDFDIKAPGSATGDTHIGAYALYYVCDDVGGQCLYLRQDVDIRVRITTRDEHVPARSG